MSKSSQNPRTVQKFTKKIPEMSKNSKKCQEMSKKSQNVRKFPKKSPEFQKCDYIIYGWPH